QAARARGYTALGGAGADPGGEDVGRGSGRDAASRRCAAAGTGRQPLDRLERCGGASREDRTLRRARLPASGIPCAGPGPGAVPAALCREGVPVASQEVWVTAVKVLCLHFLRRGKSDSVARGVGASRREAALNASFDARRGLRAETPPSDTPR